MTQPPMTTNKSHSIVTVPGDIPGLIQRGATIRYYGYRCVVVTDPSYGVLLLSDGISLVKSNVHFVSLDLTHPGGRDIAARWMAEKLGMEVGLTAPEFIWMPPCAAEILSACWCLRGPGWSRYFISANYARLADTSVSHAIPGLPLDPTQGIEAIRLIILHLAGRLP